jgi:hypothetical protein
MAWFKILTVGASGLVGLALTALYPPPPPPGRPPPPPQAEKKGGPGPRGAR